jgi:hypothetical protein
MEKSLVALEKGRLMAQLIEEELGGQISFSAFKRVKLPSGGGLSFEIQSGENPEVCTEIVGVVIDHYPIKTYYKSKNVQAGVKPDCSSVGGIEGTGIIGGLCANCPKNKFITGVGKECSDKHRVFILRQGDTFPIYLDIPTMSIANWRKYMTRLVTTPIRKTDIVTKISLKKAVGNLSKKTYSQVTLTAIQKLTPETAAEMLAYSKGMQKMTRSLGGVFEDEENNKEVVIEHLSSDSEVNTSETNISAISEERIDKDALEEFNDEFDETLTEFNETLTW